MRFENEGMDAEEMRKNGWLKLLLVAPVENVLRRTVLRRKEQREDGRIYRRRIGRHGESRKDLEL